MLTFESFTFDSNLERLLQRSLELLYLKPKDGVRSECESSSASIKGYYILAFGQATCHSLYPRHGNVTHQ